MIIIKNNTSNFSDGDNEEVEKHFDWANSFS